MKRIILSILYTIAFSIVYAQETMEWETLHDITVNSTPEGYVFETVDTLRESFAITAYKTGKIASIEFKTDRQNVNGISFLYKNGDNYEKAFYIYKRRQYYFIGTPYGKETHTQTGIKSLNNGDIVKMSKDYNNIYFHHNGEVLKTIEIAEEHKGKEFYGRIGIIGAFGDQDYKVENVVFKGFVEPEKEPFEVKVVDPFYQFDTGKVPFSEIVTGLINENGDYCEDCTSKGKTINKIANGEYFYHIGINGDKSYFNNVDFQNIQKKVLDEELVMLGTLLMNNTNSKQNYTIQTNFPGNNIIIRRESLLDNGDSKTLSNNNMRIIGDPLSRLIENNGLWEITLYPNEIVKLVTEFESDYKMYNASMEYGLTISNTNLDSKLVSYDITVFNRLIPSSDKIVLANLIDFEDYNKHFQTTHRQVNNNLAPSYPGRGLIYNPDGSITNPENIRTASSYITKFLSDNSNINIALFNPGQGHFQLTNGGIIEMHSDEWIKAYVNTLIIMENYLIESGIDPSRILVWVIDENTALPVAGVLERLYTRIQSDTNFKILQSFGSKYNDTLVIEVAPYLDYVMSANSEVFKIPGVEFNQNYNEIIYTNNFSRNSGIIEFFRSGVIGGDNGPLLSAVNYNRSHNFYPNIHSNIYGNDWNGLTSDRKWDPKNHKFVIGEIATFYNIKCDISHVNGNEILQPYLDANRRINNHWNPTSINVCPEDTNSNNLLQVPSIRTYAQLQGNVDANIYMYLQNLNNPSVKTQLESLKSRLNNNANYIEINKISNELKEIYNNNSSNNDYVIADADAFVDKCILYGCLTSNGNVSNDNFGSTIQMKNARRFDGLQKRNVQSYLKFDLDQISNISPSDNIYLVLTYKDTRVFQYNEDDGVAQNTIASQNQSIPLNYYVINNNTWDENTITGNNQPVINFDNDPNSILLGNVLSKQLVRGEKVRFDLTNIVKEYKNEGKQYITIGINTPDATVGTSPSTSFYTKEINRKEYRPRLEVVKSTQSSSRKVVESKEIPTFEEPISFTVVYPNPTEGLVNVNAEKDIRGWKIVSLSGKVIGHNQFNTPKRRFSTNISNQAEGLYMIQIVYTDGTTESKKIMKK